MFAGFAAGACGLIRTNCGTSSRTSQGFNLGHYLIDRHAVAAGEGVFAVAPGTSQITTGQAHEDAGKSRVRRFALERTIDFGNSHKESVARKAGILN
jgi:hypothetical protein